VTKLVGLLHVVLFGLLAYQAEPITATIAYVAAALHLVAVIKFWYDNAA
jgi:hypothetical protein